MLIYEIIRHIKTYRDDTSKYTLSCTFPLEIVSISVKLVQLCIMNKLTETFKLEFNPETLIKVSVPFKFSK